MVAFSPVSGIIHLSFCYETTYHFVAKLIGKHMFIRTSKPTEVPVISLEKCEYDKTRKVLGLSSEYFGMPLTFNVKSHYTGKVVRFVPVNPADPLYDEDQWDGEQQIYRPVDSTPGVDYMVIYNQY